MLARKVPNGSGAGNRVCQNVTNRAQSQAQPAPQDHPQLSSVANGTRTDKQAADVASPGRWSAGMGYALAELRTAPPLGSIFQGRR